MKSGLWYMSVILMPLGISHQRSEHDVDSDLGQESNTSSHKQELIHLHEE